eukprot:TRINITY_DN650_c0_g1_i1.p1 TRINITY_DN650_c0_g1~~TRINITY_DN650_c0_g1_i1.p1  ORF type:complete len:137 (+),score=36.78 TRINITY_DN650_c0_g1_i1:25-435(+)
MFAKASAFVLLVTLCLANAAQVAQINLYRGSCNDTSSELAEYQVYDKCSRASNGAYEYAVCSSSGATIYDCSDSGCNSCSSVTYRLDQCIPDSTSGFFFQYSCVDSVTGSDEPHSSAASVAPLIALVATVVFAALF